jgi:hypothetical protein
MSAHDEIISQPIRKCAKKMSNEILTEKLFQVFVALGRGCGWVG